MLLDEALRQVTHHGGQLAQQLFVALRRVIAGVVAVRIQQAEYFFAAADVGGVGQVLQLALDQALLAAAHALAQGAAGGQLLRSAAQADDGLRDAANLVVAAVLQAHAGVAACQRLQHGNGVLQRTKAAAQIKVQPQQHCQHQRQGAAQHQPIQKTASRSGRALVVQRDQRAGGVASQVGDGGAVDHVGDGAGGLLAVVGDARRNLHGGVLPDRGVGGGAELAAQVNQVGVRAGALGKALQRVLGVARQHDDHRAVG